jgi:hypothetical protein
MKISTWVLLSGALAAFPAMGATHYAVLFQTTSGSPAPVSGDFYWDGTSFSNFLVTWNGVTFDLTSSANAPTINVGSGCAGAASTPAYGFLMMSENCPGASYGWTAQSLPFVSFFSFGENGNMIFGPGAISATASASGTWNIAQMPEPGTLGMLGLGGVLLGGIGLMRRRQTDNAAAVQQLSSASSGD